MGGLVFVYILGHILGVLIYLFFFIRYQRKMKGKIQEFMNNQNKTKYNARGIHWVIMWGPKL